MPQFTRRTILAAVDFILVKTHAEIDRFALEYGLEGVVVGYSKTDRVNALGRYLLRNPEATTDTGDNLTDAITLALVGFFSKITAPSQRYHVLLFCWHRP